MNKPGMRVGAISHAEKDGTVYVFGFGVYEGDFVPDEDAAGMGPLLREAEMTNPKIKLDNGDVVWGCECWWGPEDVVKEKIAAYKKQVAVSIAECREQAKGGSDAV